MWLADAADLRDRLFETLWFYHAFPPGMNAITGVLLKVGNGAAASLAHGLFLALGIVFVNVLQALARAAGLGTVGAALVTLAFVLTPPVIYFEHLYLYDWPVAVLLASGGLLLHRGVRDRSTRAWHAFFAVCAAIALTRSTFHLVWYAATTSIALWLAGGSMRRAVARAAALPALVVIALYAKNYVLFGDFAASTFAPAAYSQATVARLPERVRTEWIRDGTLSPFAAVSVYAPPRQYARFFEDDDRAGWPPQVTRLENVSAGSPNFNHWWLLVVHEARRRDAQRVLLARPIDYMRAVALGVREMFGPTTRWHPRDGAPGTPHEQHRQVLGSYEAWFNRLVHTRPFAPVGLYLAVPLLLGAAAVYAAWLLAGTPAERARGALLCFCVVQVVYVVAVSAMATAGEWARYRFPIEWMLWMAAAALAHAAAAWLDINGRAADRVGA